MRNYYENNERRRTDRTTAYFNQGDKKGVIDFAKQNMNNGEPLNIIGHSYGATTAIAAAKALAKAGICVDNLIGVDGVRKAFQRGNPSVLNKNCSCANIVGVDATGGGTTGDLTENAGKALGSVTTFGSGTPRAFRPGNADVNITSSSSHGDFAGAYQSPGPNGRSARDIVNGSYP